MGKNKAEKVEMTAPGGVGTARVATGRVDEFTRNGWARVAEAKPAPRRTRKATTGDAEQQD